LPSPAMMIFMSDLLSEESILPEFLITATIPYLTG